ncbi:hypothetical protein NHX12_017179 [Muraenolepis orangiensis]|uniref:Cadherin domain-containing protein n=1 Tax=Muraenolepis orangiensis TaxID=630683 RepID=A0A9Q0I007_9TELE|nr:hypothetical protein NHX12_017179 [Muraenolepis orangiensis]
MELRARVARPLRYGPHGSPPGCAMKSATGTVIILVEDENDHVPDLPNKDRILCEKDGQLGSVEVNAVDADQSPFSGPFNFETLKDHNAN